MLKTDWYPLISLTNPLDFPSPFTYENNKKTDYLLDISSRFSRPNLIKLLLAQRQPHTQHVSFVGTDQLVGLVLL